MISFSVAVKMLFALFLVFLLSGFENVQAHGNEYAGRSKSAPGEVQKVQGGMINVQGVNCRSGEKLGECCPPFACEPSCVSPNIIPNWGVSRRRREAVCIEKCICEKPLVRRGSDLKCVPQNQCSGINHQK